MSNISHNLTSAALAFWPRYGVSLPSAPNALNALFSVSKKPFEETICTISEIATDIFFNVLPHFILTSPWYFFRESNPRILAACFCVYRLSDTIINIIPDPSSSYNVRLSEKHKGSVYKIQNLVVSSTNYKQLLVTFLNLFKQKMMDLAHLTNTNRLVLAFKNILMIVALLELFMLLPQTIFGLQTEGHSFKLILDTLLLSSTFIECLSTAAAGIHQISQSITSKHISLKNRVVYFTTGAIFSFLSIRSFYSTLLTIRKLSDGLAIFHQLDPQQQEGVIKNHAISTLGDDKTCNAVIIDGLSSKWGSKTDDLSFSFLRKVYQHCHVRYYRTESSMTFCQNLEDASQKLNFLHTLIFAGHGNPYEQGLNSNYTIKWDSNQEWECINQYMTSNSQIFFLGCNTASGKFSMTQQASYALLGKKITGIASYLNPFFTTHSYNNGNVQLDHNLIPYRIEFGTGQWLRRWLGEMYFPDTIISSPFDSIKTYINGSLVSK